jgi:hypothetical protein
MHASQYTFAEDDDESQDDNGEEGNDNDEDEYNDETGDEDDEYDDDEDEYNDETGDEEDEYANKNEEEDNVDCGGFDDLLSSHATDTILDQLATSAQTNLTHQLPMMVCQLDPRATTETQSDPLSFTQPTLPNVMQSSDASMIHSSKADGASPLTIIMPAPWEPAVWTCTILADSETPSVDGDLPDLTDVASSDSSSMDSPMDAQT